MLEAKTIQKYKAKKLSWLLDQAQIHVNRFVRKRDSNEAGFFTCISCKTIKHPSQCNAGHYFSRGNYGSVRFDLDNIHAQCIKCNMHEHANLIPYRENLIKKIGLERFEKLEIMAHLRGFKHDRFVLIDIIERFKDL